MQETLLRAWRGRADFEGRSLFRTWLYRIATNACLNALERILIFGSRALVQRLTPRDVIDEYRLLVYPVIQGIGARLFKEAGDSTHLKLVETQTFSSGAVALSYQHVRAG